MKKEKANILNQIALTLTRHYDSVYYVEIDTNRYTEVVALQEFEDMMIPKQGDDFFADSRKNAHKCIHPNDLELVNQIYDRALMLERLSSGEPYFVVYRLIIGGKIIHMRHSEYICDDRKYIVCCLENIEDEYREKEEQEKNLESAERMARLDDLTGVRNKKAFKEYVETLDEKINAGSENLTFGVVMCDMNDLKLTNDTRGHSFGDEAIQRTSRMICNAFIHSPVFRIGGDEFVAVISGRDYERREYLLKKLREETITNGRTRTGPVVASGLAVYEPGTDDSFSKVFERADRLMYENKSVLKAMRIKDGFTKMKLTEVPIPDERKRVLDGLFGALHTVAGGGYIYLTDMKYDFSRWSLSMVADFGMRSEYMYHAGTFFQELVHPDDIKIYREAMDRILSDKAEVIPIIYRGRKADGTYVPLATRGFILTDSEGSPEYFGGIIIQK
ncbi:MAG: diguanylate cyclase [Treponema sp.]|nr:diguanylate cyclase [Treponema sp.]